MEKNIDFPAARPGEDAENSAGKQIQLDGADSAKAASESSHPDGDAAKLLSPTRYGDWEKAGRCIDF